MASSSAITQVCFYCKSPSRKFFPGWQVRNGGFAMLCIRCSVAFNNGSFCDIFHPEDSGWRDCDCCNKRIHCGCIVAAHTYTILDFGGVKCAECTVNEALAPHRCSPTFWSPEPMMETTDSPRKLPIESEKIITGRKSDPCNHVAGVKLGVDLIPSPDPVVRIVSHNEIAKPTTLGAVCHAKSPKPKSEEETSVNSPAETNKFRKKNGRKHRKDLTQVQYRYLPKITREELREICRESRSYLIPLFEKELTASDADTRNGRLVLPKRCAEAYFPKISGEEGTYLVVQDTKGTDWEVYYRYWANSNGGKMYVLEGLKDYIILMQWKAGDTVRFFKREGDGKLFMQFKKYHAPKPVLKIST